MLRISQGAPAKTCHRHAEQRAAQNAVTRNLERDRPTPQKRIHQRRIQLMEVAYMRRMGHLPQRVGAVQQKIRTFGQFINTDEGTATTTIMAGKATYAASEPCFRSRPSGSPHHKKIRHRRPRRRSRTKNWPMNPRPDHSEEMPPRASRSWPTQLPARRNGDGDNSSASASP